MKRLFSILALAPLIVFAQSTISIHGTSTLHDWKMVSQSVESKIESEGNKITSLDVSVQIKTLKSGDEGLDKKAYETLKIDKNNVITFSLKEHNVDNGTIKGVFRVLDKEQEATLTPEIVMPEHIMGSFDVNMTDFNLEIPSVMFGAIRAGNQVTVRYDIQR